MKTLLKCAALLGGAWLIIHRRVIVSYLTGSEMPEPPEWHKRFFPCCAEPLDDFEDL